MFVINNMMLLEYSFTILTHSTCSREQFKRRLKGWLFEYAYGRRRVW